MYKRQDLYYPLLLNGATVDGDAMVDSEGPFDASGVSSNFGIISIPEEEDRKTVLLADLEGEAEESSILSRLSIIATKDNVIKKISLVNGDSDSEITLDLLKQAIEISKIRAQQM